MRFHLEARRQPKASRTRVFPAAAGEGERSSAASKSAFGFEGIQSLRPPNDDNYADTDHPSMVLVETLFRVLAAGAGWARRVRFECHLRPRIARSSRDVVPSRIHDISSVRVGSSYSSSSAVCLLTANLAAITACHEGQDAGLIFLSSIASAVVAYSRERSLDEAVMMSTCERICGAL